MMMMTTTIIIIIMIITIMIIIMIIIIIIIIMISNTLAPTLAINDLSLNSYFEILRGVVRRDILRR